MEKTISEKMKKLNITLEEAFIIFVASTNENFQVTQDVINKYEKRISALEAEIKILKRR